MRVIILSKAPVEGKVKTRLMPEYTAKQAANIHKQMLDVVVAKVCGAFNDVWLAVDDMQHEHFESLKQQFEFTLMPQGLGDLGRRLRELMEASFEQDDVPIMFLGTDSPHVDVCRYTKVKEALESSDVVVGPVEDGGYDLIAMRKLHPELFEAILWGSDSVFQETMMVINRLSASVKVLEISFDLDRPEDLERAPPESW